MNLFTFFFILVAPAQGNVKEQNLSFDKSGNPITMMMMDRPILLLLVVIIILLPTG